MVSESIHGISRVLEVSITSTSALVLEWRIPTQSRYRFASIGDSGGQEELAWCITRAKQLGADFLLHLGDINYAPGDYDSAIKLFNEAALPCYVSIGNHDFHQDGGIYGQFLRDIGPLNNQFSIGKVRFANIDTAANILPYSAGLRGKLFDQMIAETDKFSHTVAFTHRPLFDPAAEGDHDIGSIGERNWLIDSYKKSGIRTVLCGHIHIYHRGEFAGLDNIIVGQGLGHQDLIVADNNYSKMMLAEVTDNEFVEYDIAPLAMPMRIHCHPRTDVVKDSLRDTHRSELVEEIDAACKKQS